MSFRLQITGINSKSSQSNPGIDIEEPNPIRALIASHADLSASHYDLSANHSGLKSTVTDLSASHYDLSRNNSALKSTVSDLSASHYDLSANHRALKSTVSDLSASHYDLSRNNSALKSTVSDLSASHYDLSANHSALKTLVTDLSGSHYDLSANHRALKTLVTDLSTNNNIRFNNIDISLSQVYTKTQSDSIFVSKSNIDLSNLSTNIIPSTDNTYKIGDISKNWRNAYIKDISSTNIDIANNLNVFGPTQLTNTLNVAGNVTLNGSTLYAPSAFTIDPYGHDNNTGTVFINGNLIVQGLTTTINSTTIDISDKKILLASNAKNSIEATGAGFEISGANVNFIYDYPSSAFRSSIGLSISGNVVPANSTNVNLGQSDKRWNIAYIDELNVNSFTNSINGANITSETITSTQIMNNTIVDGDISNNAAIAFSKINATNAIVDGDISDNANILGSKLANNSITSDKINQSNNWTFSQLTSNTAYIRDISASNISISGNILPLDNSSSDLGSLTKRWRNIFVNDLSVSTINGQAYSATPAIDLTSVSGNIIPSSNNNFRLGDTSRNWSNAYIRDISATNISVSGNILLNIGGGNIRNINQLSADTSNNIITTRNRIYQNISTTINDICWNSVNGYYGLAKDAYPALNPYSSGIAAVSNMTIRTLPSDISKNDYWNSICWSPELRLFVAVSSSSGVPNRCIMTSNDGITWSSQSSVNGYALNAVAWSPKLGMFVALGSIDYGTGISGSLYSYNGYNWNPVITKMRGTGAICWSPELEMFTACTDIGGTFYSYNGINWSSNTGVTANSMCWSPELKLFVGAGAGMIYSSDGINWSTSSSGFGFFGEYYYGVCWSPQVGKFVAVSGPYPIIYSYNGKDWIVAVSGVFGGGGSQRDLKSVIWSAQLGLFIAAGTNLRGAKILYSIDGINWTEKFFDNFTCRRICWSPELGILVSVGNTSYNVNYPGDSIVFTSSLKARPPTSYNVFDSSFNSIDETGKWTFSAIDVSSNLNPSIPLTGSVGTTAKPWGNAVIRDLSVSTINGQAYSAGGGGTAIDLTSVSGNIIPSLNNNFRLGDTSRNWSNAYIHDISATNISISGNIIFSISGGSMRIAADASTNSITSTHRIYQNISGSINDLSWSSVNGYYALAKDAYPGLNPLSSGDLAVKTLTTRNIGTNGTASWNAICWSPELGIFVVGSLTGIGIMISSNGVNWTPINVENGNSRSSIVWSRELRIFVAVFWNGYASTSTNGINWIQRDQFSNASWYSVCWAPEIGRFVAVGLTGTNNRVMTSVNGINWTRGTNIPQSDWYSVVWSPELRIFVAMSAGGINYAMTSRDGINWAMQTNALFDYQWRSICWSPQLGIFVAIGQNRSLISNNGINWNIYNSSVAIGDFSISWSPELKLFFSTSNGGTIATSNDGINWTTRVSTGDGYRCSCWSPELGIFVSPSTRGYVLTSSLKGRPPTSYNVFDSSFNSIDQSGNWTFQNITTNSRIYQNISGGINDLSWSSVNGYYALAKDAYPALNPLSSGDLAVKTWIGRVSANETNSWRSICWSPQLRIFVAVAGTGTNRVMTSPDGITWTGRLSSNESHYWSSVCWSPELRLFVAVSFGGWADQAMTSSNGITWTTRVTPPGGWWSVCWSPERGIFVAVARTNTKVMTSSDGITWTARTSANETNVWYSVCWSPQLGIFVAVAQYGSSSTETDRIMTSPDGISWSKSTSTIGGDSVCWSEELGLFVSVRDINVLTSPNGITWTTRAYNAVGSLVSVCWSKQLRLFVAVVYYGSSNNNKVITSPNGTTWTGRLSADIDGTTGWSSICWSPELGIFAAVAETGINRVMTSSLQGRPPTSYNVFDSSFNSIDQSGNWTFQNIDVSSNLNPSIPLTGSVGTTAKPWGNAVIRDLSVSTINGQAYSAGGTAINLTSVSGNIIPSLNNNFRLGDTSRNWSNAYIRDISASNIDISGNIIFSISGGYMRIAADASTSSITTSHRIYQNISGGINDPSWSAVNGYYALAKDSYPGLNPYSSGAKAIKTWTARASVNGNSNRWTSICWSPELRIFVAVAESFASNNRVMTSPDGITWTGRLSSNDSNAWQSVCWSPELRIFVAVASGGDNKVMTSSDGITWTGQTSSNETNGWWGVCWSPQLRIFVAVASSGSNIVMTSSDGITWTGRTSSNETNGWWGVCWSPQLSLFVAVSRSGSNRVMTSPNGTTWTGRTSSNETNSWRDVCWSGELGLFVAVGYNGSNRVMTSSNGITWTGRLSANEANEWWGVCWSPELRLFVAVANIGTNRVMISNNGTTWTEQLVPITGNWRNVCWSPELGLFAATANFGGNFRVMTSSLQGRPPTSYNVFDSTFNSIDQSGNWTFQNIDISTNLNPSSSLTGNLGTASKIWGNAVIRDLSIGSIDVGINVYPSLPNSGSLGLSNKRWANAFVNDLSVSTINGQAYSAGTAIDLTSVSGNIIPSLNNTFRLGDISRNWSNAYIHDISATNISVSGNIIPLDTSSSDLGSLTKRWRNIYVNDLSVITINGQAYSKLAELTTNLIIHNADTSTARLYYKIKLINAGTITAYTNFPIGGVGSGMTHSVRVCIPNIATIIGVEIDPQDINILSSVVSAGAIPYGEFVDETLSFTFDPAGYDNIEIGFEVVAKTGWYGNIFLELLSLRPNGAVTTYNYTIYKGSTDQTPVLVSNQTLSNNLYNTVIGSVAHVLTSADRLENDSSSFFVTINSFSGGSLTLVSIQNGTLLYNPYQVQPSVIGTDVRIRFAMEPD